MALFHPKKHKIGLLFWGRYKPAELEGHPEKATLTIDDTSVEVLMTTEAMKKLSAAGVQVSVAKG
ncbi:hypothetical protein KY362_02565 [Candidatus Woesearchaeota archaeon]|nr:hypothetical protein [Candidatus Woesearchaeota archaeon]